MPQPISLGTVLGGRYIVLDEVQTTPEQDHVLGGKDQILGREVTILVPSEAHTARVVENARSMAIGAVDADLHILDLGQSGSTPYLVTSFAAPAVLLEELLAEPGTIDDDTLSDDIFGRPRSASSSAYVLDDGEPDAPSYADASEEDSERWDDEDDIRSAPAAPKVERRMGRIKRAPEASTRATLFDRAAAGRGPAAAQRPVSRGGQEIDPSYDGDNRYDSFEYEYEKSQAAGAAAAAGQQTGRKGRTAPSADRRGAAPRGGSSAARGATAAAGGSRGASGSSKAPQRSGGAGRLLLLLLLLLLLVLGLIAAFIFGGLGRLFDSGESAGAPASQSAAPTEAPEVAEPAAALRLVPEDPTLMADQDDSLPQALDGDPSTSWISYGFSSPDFGQLVSSIALAVRFEEPTVMHEVTIFQTSGSGGAFTVYVADGPSLEGAVEVGKGQFDGPETTVELSEEAAQDEHSHLIIEWTELPSLEEPIAGYGYGLRIDEIEVS